MDRLSPVAKRVLQTAAVIGQEAPFSLLAAMTKLSQEALSQSLAQLQAAELLHETCLVPESVYTFKHVLIQETAYHTLLESTRRQQHCRLPRYWRSGLPRWWHSGRPGSRITTGGRLRRARHSLLAASWAARGGPFGPRRSNRALHASVSRLRTLPVTPPGLGTNSRYSVAWVQLATRGAATPR